MNDPIKPSVRSVMGHPCKGDLLCFDGIEWQVARHNGWQYRVHDPDEPINVDSLAPVEHLSPLKVSS